MDKVSKDSEFLNELRQQSQNNKNEERDDMALKQVSKEEIDEVLRNPKLSSLYIINTIGNNIMKKFDKVKSGDEQVPKVGHVLNKVGHVLKKIGELDQLIRDKQ